MDVPNTGGLLVWNLLCVTLLARRILRRLLDFSKTCVILLTSYSGTGKIVVILSLFSSGSMHKEKVSIIHETSLSKLVVVTPQDFFLNPNFWSSLASPFCHTLSRREWDNEKLFFKVS
jgi:hypothetical protein